MGIISAFVQSVPRGRGKEKAPQSSWARSYAKLENGSWSDPIIIAQGKNWFVNWADFPSIVSVDSSFLLAHWLQKSADGTYDYDVRISRSNDGGQSWSPSIIPHKDGINAEHGFVSMVRGSIGKALARIEIPAPAAGLGPVALRG